MQAVLYYAGLACLFTHELDAMTHAEWRLMVVLRELPDATASPAFVVLHVPLFFLLLWLSQHGKLRIRDWTRTVVAAFLVVHALLHFGLSSEPLYDFHRTLSRALLRSAAPFRAAYLARRFRRIGPARAHRPGADAPVPYLRY